MKTGRNIEDWKPMEPDNPVRDVRILPLSSLLLHEMTQEEMTERLKKMIRASTVMKNPIIIERRSRLILDGMHRVAALKELGYKNIPCQLVDYASPELKVGAWCPHFSAKRIGLMPSLAPCTGVSFHEGLKLVKNSKTAFLLVFIEKGQRKCFAVGISKVKLSVRELAARQQVLLRTFSAKEKISYVSDENWADCLAQGDAVLLRRPYTKAEILVMARKGKLFAPKSTRHCLKMRILGVNVPLSWLKLGEGEANAKLQELLKKRIGQQEARYYPEPVLVLDDLSAR